MDFFSELFQYAFLRNAFFTAVLSGITCGLIGTYIVSRRLVFLSGGITHASFGGIGIAYYAGFDPVSGALIFAVLAALGIERASSKGNLREDSAIGIVWSVGMAIGIIFIYLTPGYAPNLMTFLFGNILTVSSYNLAALAGLCVVLVLLFGLFWRPVMYASFDPSYARSQKIRAGTVSAVMGILTAVTLVLSIRAVGIVMLISLLTVPAVTVNALTHSFPRILVWSAAVAAAGNIAGLWLSYRFDVPAGAATIFILIMALFMVRTLLWLRRRSYAAA